LKVFRRLRCSQQIRVHLRHPRNLRQKRAPNKTPAFHVFPRAQPALSRTGKRFPRLSVAAPEATVERKTMRTLLKSLATTALAALALCAAPAAFAAAPPDLTVMEYVHVPTNHYFMTGSVADQQLLASAPVNQSFLPTGRSFSAWSDGNQSRPANAVAVQRFFVPAASSHVFTSSAADIALLRTLTATTLPGAFVDEGVAFFALAAAGGRCESGSHAVFRAFNNRPDGNHRYSTELELHATMVRGGFADEAVAFCANTVGSDAAVEKRAGTPRPSGEDITVSGSISLFVSAASFSIGSQAIDASQARFEGGTAAALANGVAASVEGVLVNGVLKATEVKLSFAGGGSPALVDEIHGFVTALGTTGTVFVNGIAVDVSRASFIRGTAAQLVVGAEVEVHGGFVNGVFIATLVQLEDSPSSPVNPPAAGSAEIDGTISQFVSVASFRVGTQQVDASNAVFEDGTAAGLANGLRVEVHGNVVAGVLVATRVEFKRARVDGGSSGGGGSGGSSGGGSFEATGSISNYVSVASFTVAGVRVDASAAIFKDGSAADLRNGAVVEVKGTLANGVVRASVVEIRSGSSTPPAGSTGTPFEATGGVTDFVSVASFRVGGVLIDASAATFVDGTASGLRNGVTVEVNGTLVNGVVRATRVEFKDGSSITPPTGGNPPDGSEFETTGLVSGYVSVAAFTLGSVSIDATSASFERGTAADLRNGVRVEVRGTWRSGKVIANRVRFER